MNRLFNEVGFQEAGYENHRTHVSNLGAIKDRECVAMFHSYVPVLKRLAYQKTYRLKLTKDAGLLKSEAGCIELPLAIFNPLLNLSDRVVTYGEINSWIEALEEA